MVAAAERTAAGSKPSFSQKVRSSVLVVASSSSVDVLEGTTRRSCA
jgi:hypothetical protein